MSEFIRVACRVRPFSGKETKEITVAVKNNGVDYTAPKDSNRSGDKSRYEFDYAFDQASTQEDIYKTAVDPFLKDIFSGYSVTIFAYGQTGCLDPETEVIMYSGSIKKAKDVVLGDLLMGDDGTPRKVLELFEGEDEMYEITQDRGMSYRINSRHILSLYNRGQIVDLPLRKYLSLTNKEQGSFTGIRVAAIPLRSKVQVTPIGKGPYKGWLLDGNHRHLLKDFTVTHNSGKTHTMTGYSHIVDNKDLLYNDKVTIWKSPKDMGVIPRLLKGMFDNIAKTPAEQEFMIQISYVELYLEQIRDLINPRKDDLKIRETPARGVWIADVTEVYVSSFEDIITVMRSAEANRTVGSTEMNRHSSRSHSILTLTLTQHNLTENTKKISRMCFVDLAGSEKVSKTKATGVTLKEATYTNKSLTTLGIVIRKLVERSRSRRGTQTDPASGDFKTDELSSPRIPTDDTPAGHIPYRDSKLTRILSESLGGNAKTLLLVTISPSVDQADETLSTLRFGQSTKSIKNQPKINIEVNPEEYQRVLDEKERQILSLQAIIDQQKLDLDKLTEENSTLTELCRTHKLPLPQGTPSFPSPTALSPSQRGVSETLSHGVSETLKHLEAEIHRLNSVVGKKESSFNLLQDELSHSKAKAERLEQEILGFSAERQYIEELTESLNKGRMEKDASQRVIEEYKSTIDGLYANIRKLTLENKGLKRFTGRTSVVETTPEESKKLAEETRQMTEEIEQLEQSHRSEMEGRLRQISFLELSLQEKDEEARRVIGELTKKVQVLERKTRELEAETISRTVKPVSRIFG